MSKEPNNRLYMKVELGTIDDLGVKLYSGFPAALAELVANAWDADATRVDIDASNERIVITDDGHGMNRADIQNKYLTVGYRRRDAGETQTPQYKRPVMGRKGIGRLALFSIANQVKVSSVKGEDKIGLKLSYPGIKQAIGEGRDYYPQEINTNEIDINCGTKIELTDFKHQPRGLQERLKERLARRFSIIGEKYKFKVFVNGEEISVSDRNYFSKIQYLWTFGDAEKAKEIKDACTKCEERPVGNDIENADNKLSGWIGSVFKQGQLKDDSGENLNHIVVMMRGRLAQEDMLHSLGLAHVGEKYLVGEIHADHLDDDGEEDMATSGRQHLNQNDLRYQKIKSTIEELVKRICKDWHDLRGKKAAENILSNNKEIKEWYDELSPDAKKITGRLFKDTASIDDEKRKKNLVSCIVPAVVQIDMRDNLDKLQKIRLEDLDKFSELFNYQDDIEAVSYYRITEGRLSVIEKLNEYVEDDTIEEIIQKHIYDHLWLLDPSWERSCTEQFIEKRVKKRWQELDSKTSEKAKKIKQLRLDIQYKKTSGQHVVIELKRPKKHIDKPTLEQQIVGYMDAVSQELEDAGKNGNNVEGIIILGERPIGWENTEKRKREEKSLKELDIRITTYQEIISQAERQYKDYMEAQKKASNKVQRIKRILSSINV